MNINKQLIRYRTLLQIHKSGKMTKEQNIVFMQLIEQIIDYFLRKRRFETTEL